ncbi:MAG TPA: VPLPA-CTERM sorting domain-containing protein [Paracoccaceae bacterium]
MFPIYTQKYSLYVILSASGPIYVFSKPKCGKIVALLHGPHGDSKDRPGTASELLSAGRWLGGIEMFDLKKLATLTAAALIAGVTWSSSASAASVACDTLAPDVTNMVTPNIGCEALTSADNDSNAAVSGMFGVTDWMQIAKVDPVPGTDGGLTIGGDEQEGTWSISGAILAAYESIMLIFKGGDQALPTAVVGYLINTSPGVYTSPFYDIQPGGPLAGTFRIKDISHISLYVANPSPIPLPAAGILLIGALGGLGLLRRRRKAA